MPPEQAFAQAQSIPGSLQYAVPGVGYDDNYGSLTVGAQTGLFGLDANLGTSAHRRPGWRQPRHRVRHVRRQFLKSTFPRPANAGRGTASRSGAG